MSSQPSATPWEERVRTHLEQWPLTMAEALNARDFDRKHPAWAILAPGLQAGPFPPDSFKIMNVKTFLKYLTDISQQPPRKIRVIDSTSSIEDDTVTVITNIGTEMLDPGIVFHTTFFTEFKVIDGRWLATTIRGIGGGYV